MANTFGRHRTGVERVDPNFGENLQVVYMKRRMACFQKGAEARTGAIREAHATGYGLVRGEVDLMYCQQSTRKEIMESLAAPCTPR